jgi:hypothetical protein
MSKRNGMRLRRLTAIGIATLAAVLPVAGENVDPDADGSQYAWSENAGWVNAEPSGDSGPGVQVSDFALTGWMWSENAGWISLSCTNTSSCGTVEYGVTNDGHGHLGGYAWAENAGWIDFAPPVGGAGIDPGSGEFSGYAWAENLGWLSLSCANTSTCGSIDYGIKTDWCQTVASAPAGRPDLSVAKSGSDVVLDWSALGGSDWYEVVSGDLSALRAGGGDFASATSACAVDDRTATSATVGGTPASGQAYWYLVRGVNCKGNGTYDSPGTGQAGPRDPGITASGNDCS